MENCIFLVSWTYMQVNLWGCVIKELCFKTKKKTSCLETFTNFHTAVSGSSATIISILQLSTTIFTPLELLSITKLGKPENPTLKFSKQISGLLKFLSQIIDNKHGSMNFVAWFQHNFISRYLLLQNANKVWECVTWINFPHSCVVRLFFVFRVFVNPVLELGLGFGWEARTRPGPCACCCFHQLLSSLLRLCCVFGCVVACLVASLFRSLAMLLLV